ncbi:MAG: cation:dicarboxylate symporter family transporter, partial [Advenella sp.]|uniref:cation:dicarboxylate symporter family transporter n=1 Tax=Advenella sp. TaxID=1872388 RepID=UPI003F9D0078
MTLQHLFAAIARGNLVRQIIIGLVLGILFGVFFPQAAQSSQIIGTFFTGALKAVAPVLVFVLVMAAIAQHRSGTEVYIKPILLLYVLGTFAAALVA